MNPYSNKVSTSERAEVLKGVLLVILMFLGLGAVFGAIMSGSSIATLIVGLPFILATVVVTLGMAALMIWSAATIRMEQTGKSRAVATLEVLGTVIAFCLSLLDGDVSGAESHQRNSEEYPR